MTIKSRSWSDLPTDVQFLILERLHLVDRIRFQAVCKNWGIAPIQYIQSDKSPWIMNYCFSTGPTVCSLSEPSRKLAYILKDERAWNLLSRSRVCTSRFGWVLLAKRVNEIDDATFYYVHNPLTNEIIPLPIIKWQREQIYVFPWENRATFSCVPTSSICEFIMQHICKGEEVFISTYSNGDTEWKTQKVTPPYGSFFPNHDSAYMDGTFYCYSVAGKLSSFNVTTQEWRLLTESCWKNCWEWAVAGGMSYFFAYDGHLYLVQLIECNVNMSDCDIYRFHWSDKAWKKLESLEGGAIFLGRFSFGVAAGEQTKMVANRVYYFSPYSSSPRFIVYGSDEKRRPDEMGEMSESQNTIYFATPTGMGGSGRIWMEPPLLMHV